MEPVKVWREKRTARGNPHWVNEVYRMPRIDTTLLDCALYLYPTEDEANLGRMVDPSAPLGVPRGGSGFILGVPSRHRGWNHLYAVTNRHVIWGALFIRLNTQDGAHDVIPTQLDEWYCNDSNDVAVRPIGLSPARFRFRFVRHQSLLSRETIRLNNLGPGDEVFVVGRFVNHEGRQRNTPAVRFGHLAMMPDEPLYHPTNIPQIQESFLVDVRTVGGFSGSPVFLCPPLLRDGEKHIELRAAVSGPWLLGVEWGGVTDGHRNHTGMYGVIPAWILNDLLNDPRLVEIRNRSDDTMAEEMANAPTEET